MQNAIRNWVVLLIGGSSGSGKTSISYELARFYNINVIKVDAISQALKAITTVETLPTLHYWETGVNWLEIGSAANVEWLINVSSEISPAIKAVVDMHIEDSEPIIIEGDFIHPQLCANFTDARIKSIFIHESETEQLVQNYFEREKIQQPYRAGISRDYGNWLVDTCEKFGVLVVESRPWNNLMKRIIDILK